MVLVRGEGYVYHGEKKTSHASRNPGITNAAEIDLPDIGGSFPIVFLEEKEGAESLLLTGGRPRLNKSGAGKAGSEKICYSRLH